MAKLVIDNREKDVISKLNGDNIMVERLDIADFQFYYNDNPFLFVERKTINDLEQSIKDGRYREQKQRLKNSGVDILYIIEGRMKSYKSMNPGILWGAMANTLFRDNIRVFRVENTDETVEFLKKILSKLDSQEYTSQKCELDYVDIVQSKKKYQNSENCFIFQLCTIPGVSTNMAREISKVYPNMFTLVKAYLDNENDSECKKMLQNILIPIKGDKQRKLGKVVSERVFEYLKK